MTIDALLTALTDLDITLTPTEDGTGLIPSIPRDQIPADLAAAIAAHKPALLDRLRWDMHTAQELCNLLVSEGRGLETLAPPLVPVWQRAAGAMDAACAALDLAALRTATANYLEAQDAYYAGRWPPVDGSAPVRAVVAAEGQLQLGGMA